MTVTEFEYLIRIGSGKAVIELCRIQNKAPYRKALADFIAEDGYLPRSLGEYEKQLIDCFDDSASLTEEIVETLFSQFSKGRNLISVPLLILLGCKERLAEAAENLYSYAYPGYLSQVKNGKADKMAIPFAHEYFAAVESLGILGMFTNTARLRQILYDMADLYEYADDPVIPSHADPILSIWFQFAGRKETLEPLIDELCSKHKYGSRIDPRNKISPRSSRTVPDNITAKDIVNSGIDDFPALYTAFLSASDETVNEVARYMLSETDFSKLQYLVLFFMEHFGDEPRMFPLDPTPIIEIAEKYRPYTTEGRTMPCHSHRLFPFLQNIKHPAIRKYAEFLLSEEDLLPVLRRYAYTMLWGANYIPSDRDKFVSVLKSSSYECGLAAPALIYHMKKGTPDIPYESAYDVFGNADYDSRLSIAEFFIKNGMMTDALAEECKLDAYQPIQELGLDYMQKQSPKK